MKRLREERSLRDPGSRRTDGGPGVPRASAAQADGGEQASGERALGRASIEGALPTRFGVAIRTRSISLPWSVSTPSKPESMREPSPNATPPAEANYLTDKLSN